MRAALRALLSKPKLPMIGNTLHLNASSSDSLWTTNASGVLSGHPTDSVAVRSWTDAERHTSTQAGSAGTTVEPKLLLFTQRTLKDAAGLDVQAWPDYIAGKAAVIETLPFDGLLIHSPHGSSLMDGTLHSQAAIAADWATFSTITWTRMQNNFAVFNLDRNADFFDSWTNTISSCQNFAAAVRDAGVPGICFDNEEYGTPVWDYPDAVTYPGTSLAAYYTQAQLRGNQIVTAIQTAYPACQIMFLISLADDSTATSSLEIGWTRDPTKLRGAFSVGMVEASLTPVIDGNENGYSYRSQAEFDIAYSWRKSGIVTDPTPTPYIPSSMNATWSSKISCAEPTFNLPMAYSDGTRPMDATIMPGILNMALHTVDKYVWFYWEENRNWYNTVDATFGVTSTWLNLVNTQWLATRGSAIASAPLWKASNTGLAWPALDFNGTTQFLKCYAADGTTEVTPNTLVSATEFTIAIVVYIDAITGTSTTDPTLNDTILANGASTFGIHLISNGGGSYSVQFYNNDGAKTFVTVPVLLNTPSLLVFRHYNGTIYGSVNGGVEVSAASGNTTSITGLPIAIGSGTSAF